MAENTRRVVDSSFVLSFLLPDESDIVVEQTFEQYSSGKLELFAPVLLPFEVFNGLKSAILTKRVKPDIAEQLGKQFLKLHINLESIILLEALMLANTQSISVYDASYIWLAKEKGVSLLSLDNRLKKIAGN